MKKLLLILFSFFLLAGCKDQGVSPVDDSIMLDGSINGKEMVTGLDYRFRLELEVLADAGFQWDCSFSDSSVVQLDRVSYRSGSTTYPPPPGGSVFETFYFKTNAQGSCTVRLIHHQAWMPNVPPRDTVSFQVYVR
ncbi:MAG TPA: protease inhibitor I42 family protein [Desulfomonilaceae bacterium]|nr:protease inhibitor I42 family protein [Desulfomonilaceae bacterium]